MRTRVLGSVLLSAVLSMSLPLRGEIIHIDGSVADDGGDGSAGSPYKRIDQGAAVAEAGDVVRIRSGIYRECVKPVNGGTADARIVYEGVRGSHRLGFDL